MNTIQKNKVENMTSPRGNREVPNQFIITLYDENGIMHEYFQSYKSIIALNVYGKEPKTYLDEHYWDYSTTTGKYRNQFLGEDKAETMRKIKSGEYLLANLN